MCVIVSLYDKFSMGVCGDSRINSLSVSISGRRINTPPRVVWPAPTASNSMTTVKVNTTILPKTSVSAVTFSIWKIDDPANPIINALSLTQDTNDAEHFIGSIELPSSPELNFPGGRYKLKITWTDNATSYVEDIFARLVTC